MRGSIVILAINIYTADEEAINSSYERQGEALYTEHDRSFVAPRGATSNR